MRVKPSVLFDWLHIFVLVGFAVAQPIYDMVSQSPEFFVAHKARPILIASVVFVLSFGLPLGCIIFELLARIVGEWARRWVHGIIVFILVLLAGLAIGRQVGMGPDVIIIGIAFIFATLFVGLYIRSNTIRMFLNLLSPAVVIFPLWFLLFTPIKSLLLTRDIGVNSDIEIHNPVPVVVVVLDEFNLTPLLDAAGRIDRIRFPNFAEFANNSWWFPNAIAASITTRGALPSIVSGLQSQSPYDLTPTANDFPRNVFTMLGDRYGFNVIESVTTLCPQSYCGQEKKSTGLGGVTTVFSDLVVIYLHLISPPNLGQQLPPVDLQWAGFGVNWFSQFQFKKPTDGSLLHDPHKSHLYRDLYISKFLTQIGKNSNPGLHFLHILLPHAPYEFLASGHKYLPSDGAGPAGLKNDGEGWIGEEALILTAYHRYLQQIGYVDRFLGQLRHSLKTAQLYDKALIIVTADHGVSFRPNTSRRLIDKDNARDILKVPLIVKLPEQREGGISERLVSGVDILPTIMDVLKVNTSWDIDGRSLFAIEERPQKSIEIKGVGNFKAENLKGFPRLKWQIDHFEEHSSLDNLVPQGPYPSLIGRALSDMTIGKPSDMKVFHPDLSHLNNVNPESGFLPALFWAHISETNSQKLPLAVALNGRIWATTQTGEWKENNNFFSVLLPPTTFKRGRNHVGVYLIDESGKALTPIPLTDGRLNIRLQIENSGRLTLLFSDGPPILVEGGPNNLRGHVDRVSSPRKMFVFEGWAADIAAPQTTATVLIFAGEQLVAQVKPENERPDVVKFFHQEGLLKSGFRADVPLDLLKSLASEVRVIALSEGRTAVHLPFTDEQNRLMRPILMDDSIQLRDDHSGRLTLFYSDGPPILVEGGPNNLRGHVDRVSSLLNLLVLEGWAGDITTPHLSASVLIFAGEQLVAQVKPENERPDVVKVFHQEGLLKSGFRAAIPIDQLKSVGAEPRVIVVTAGQRAVPLHFSEEQKKSIRTIREKEGIR